MIAPRHYAIVTAAYWAFTLTDGALRMSGRREDRPQRLVEWLLLRSE